MKHVALHHQWEYESATPAAVVKRRTTGFITGEILAEKTRLAKMDVK